jgi:hypothetical protein
VAKDGSVARILSGHDFFGERALVQGEATARLSIVAQSYVLAMGLTSEDFSCAVTRSALADILATHVGDVLGDEVEEGGAGRKKAPAASSPPGAPGKKSFEC